MKSFEIMPTGSDHSFPDSLVAQALNQVPHGRNSLIDSGTSRVSKNTTSTRETLSAGSVATGIPPIESTTGIPPTESIGSTRRTAEANGSLSWMPPGDSLRSQESKLKAFEIESATPAIASDVPLINGRGGTRATSANASPTLAFGSNAPSGKHSDELLETGGLFPRDGGSSKGGGLCLSRDTHSHQLSSFSSDALPAFDTSTRSKPAFGGAVSANDWWHSMTPNLGLKNFERLSSCETCDAVVLPSPSKGPQTKNGCDCGSAAISGSTQPPQRPSATFISTAIPKGIDSKTVATLTATGESGRDLTVFRPYERLISAPILDPQQLLVLPEGSRFDDRSLGSPRPDRGVIRATSSGIAPDSGCACSKGTRVGIFGGCDSSKPESEEKPLLQQTQTPPAPPPHASKGIRRDITLEMLLNPGFELEEHHVLIDGGRGLEVIEDQTVFAEHLPFQQTLLTSLNPKGVGPAMDMRPSSRKDLLKRTAALPPRYPVRVIVALANLPFAWRVLRDNSLTDEEHSFVLRARMEQTRRVTEPIANQLRSLGAQGIEEYWIAPLVSAEIQAQDVPFVASWHEVVDLMSNEIVSTPLAYSAGLDAADGVLTRDFLEHGHIGWYGGQAGGRQRVGVIETSYPGVPDPNLLNDRHVGFTDPGGRTRVRALFDCTSGRCLLNTSPTPQVANHGTRVTQILAGDLEGYQDPRVTGTAELRRRSGIIPGAEIFYYAATGDCNVKIAAFQRAIGDRVDVANMSFALNLSRMRCNCVPNCDPCGLDSLIATMANSGILPVSAVGNDNTGNLSGTCTASYPALRRDGLAVGYLHSADEGMPAIPYQAQIVGATSSQGGMTVRRAASGGTDAPGAFAVVDLVAPGEYETSWYFSPRDGYGVSPNSPVYAGESSFAAPVVSAAAALLREAGNRAGLQLNDARALLVNMLLMGDGYHYTRNGRRVDTGFDPRSGAGRLRMHYPAELVSPMGWGWHRFEMRSNYIATYRVGGTAGVDGRATQWKGAMTWVEVDYNNIADVVFSIWNMCPAGGGPPVMLARDDSYDIRKRLVLYRNQFSPNGDRACLEVRIETFNIPDGQTRTVYVADYFHSGDPATH